MYVKKIQMVCAGHRVAFFAGNLFSWQTAAMEKSHVSGALGERHDTEDGDHCV